MGYKIVPVATRLTVALEDIGVEHVLNLAGMRNDAVGALLKSAGDPSVIADYILPWWQQYCVEVRGYDWGELGDGRPPKDWHQHIPLDHIIRVMGEAIRVVMGRGGGAQAVPPQMYSGQRERDGG